MDSHGGQRFLVELILNHRDDSLLETTYLVQWRGYPPSWNSWEPRSQMMMDVPGLVEQYEETHPLLMEGHRQTNAGAFVKGLQTLNSLVHLGRDARPPVGLIKEEGLPRGTNRVVGTTLTVFSQREAR